VVGGAVHPASTVPDDGAGRWSAHRGVLEGDLVTGEGHHPSGPPVADAVRFPIDPGQRRRDRRMLPGRG
jgi:hypothetical protein